MTIPGSRQAIRLGLAVVVGLVAFSVAQWALSQSSDAAQIVVVLEADEVDWTYQDAVREAALGRLTTDPQAQETVVALAGADATIDAELLSGQSRFSFQVSGSDPESAAAAADALMTWLVEQNLADQRQPHTEELAVLAEKRTALERQIAEFEQTSVDTDKLAAARYIEDTSLLAQYERRADEVQTDLDLTRPQFRPASPADAVGSALQPWMTALAATLATLAAFILLEPRAEAP